MREDKLKKHVLYLTITAKVFTIAYIWLNTDTGGFTSTEAISAISLVIPLFAVYLSAMYREFTGDGRFANRQTHSAVYYSSTFRNLSYFTLIGYFFIIVLFITLKAMGKLSFGQFQSAIGLVESGLGVYVGQIVFSIFKKPETQNPEN